MLVTFALEMEAINSSTTSAHIKRLLETWERFGILNQSQGEMRR